MLSKPLFDPNNIPNKIHDGGQGKHVPRYNSYTSFRSTIAPNVKPQELVDGIKSGKYIIMGMITGGMPIVDFGKKGAHIVPTPSR
ncbi:polymorphic toxin type 50 domain-containing protein [Bartonella sp. HY329]|uniref:polymorphic toxin type 50 domain-containing protein n=1 Tax=unclassified Bartonella TaxID=2645622 RepID=UPI0021C84BC5|nr:MULTISPECIES: polymorphic toxin type 50 domain-containing protein [unclassified Bartonella]UXM94389.1 polymorphic toxin type 50 domain-containing protein [Bartonella sp. HY329]UXN08712.1 polymorphic toxin type 50 domain-containing protein [Bartonella sp. HY328]